MGLEHEFTVLGIFGLAPSRIPSTQSNRLKIGHRHDVGVKGCGAARRYLVSSPASSHQGGAD